MVQEQGGDSTLDYALLEPDQAAFVPTHQHPVFRKWLAIHLVCSALFFTGTQYLEAFNQTHIPFIVPGVITKTSTFFLLLQVDILLPLFFPFLGLFDVALQVRNGSYDLVDPSVIVEHPLSFLLLPPGCDTAHLGAMWVRGLKQTLVMAPVTLAVGVLLGTLVCGVAGNSIHETFQGDACETSLGWYLAINIVNVLTISVFLYYVQWVAYRNKEGYSEASLAKIETGLAAKHSAPPFEERFSSDQLDAL
eukprot:TRINITY_DN9937_c0_g1_i5.p1 TRINITY_DN9937_c0_g1~~TRINITY_DN9937_c0_g1_i5.p1  ORF type:complete len:249 (-),score=43.01 TRINITY_DN9937_c0_g1_i5:415-1161(-)